MVEAPRQNDERVDQCLAEQPDARMTLIRGHDVPADFSQPLCRRP